MAGRVELKKRDIVRLSGSYIKEVKDNLEGFSKWAPSDKTGEIIKITPNDPYPYVVRWAPRVVNSFALSELELVSDIILGNKRKAGEYAIVSKPGTYHHFRKGTLVKVLKTHSNYCICVDKEGILWSVKDEDLNVSKQKFDAPKFTITKKDLGEKKRSKATKSKNKV